MRFSVRQFAAVTLLVGSLALQTAHSARPPSGSAPTETVSVTFTKTLTVSSGTTFGVDGSLRFQLYRGGTFIIDGISGVATERSDSYRDSAMIHSTLALPDQYKVTVVCGMVNYGLSNIDGLPEDPEYSEGPQNENGCYLLTILDEPPLTHHTNDWWHLHRKLVIDVDNNVWGAGDPNPIFMVYFGQSNELNGWSGTPPAWSTAWDTNVHYDATKYYQVTIEKTTTDYLLTVAAENGTVIEHTTVPISKVWHGDNNYYVDYFALGDPHENYYQGTMKIKSITFTARKPLSTPSSVTAENWNSFEQK